ncbi:MAG: cupin [Ilumatobacteraceae bacterium]|nr:cupin [Ilumatobacteraceae bacterium]
MITDKHGELQADLEWLVGDAETFRTTIWGRRPLRHAVPTDIDSAGIGSNRIDDLLSVDVVESWLADGARRPNFRMVQVGRTFQERDYTRAIRMGGVEVSGVADVDAIARLIAGGATLVMQNLELAFPSVRSLTEGLAHAVSHPIQANAYLTPARAEGLPRHADTHDVVVVQLVGTKTWEVDDLGTFTVSSGDVVYIPRGTPHAARTTDLTSLHLTLGVLRVTTRQVLRRMLDQLDPDLDDALPLDFANLSSDELAETMRPKIERALTMLESTDLREVAAAEVHRVATRMAPRCQHRLSAALRLTDLSQHSRLRRTGECRLEVTADRIELHLSDRVVSFPAAAQTALRAFCSSDEMTVGELVGVDEPSRIVIARRLVREGAAQL